MRDPANWPGLVVSKHLFKAISSEPLFAFGQCDHQPRSRTIPHFSGLARPVCSQTSLKGEALLAIYVHFVYHSIIIHIPR